VPAPARATYAHTHAEYPATDVFAPCGSTLVAVTDGRIDEVSRTDRWDPSTDDGALRGGLSVSIDGDDGVRYYTSHLQDVAPGLQAGDRVQGGQPLGHVGHTGNARGKPCHTHFGLSPQWGPGDWMVRRGEVWPWPYLDS
jgi:murein DD-endopeptidase MepM/ murein hydrolase activator NlpD